MAEAATTPDLKIAFNTHLHETEQQKQRLEQVFRLLGKDPAKETCEAMQGLISEAEDVAGLDGDPAAKDAAIIAAAQRIEHYEIAGYGCARSFAQRTGHEDVARLLQQSLDEENNADKILTHVAESSVNAEAMRR
jgi:ferritin-like metal-binding protein YciE